MRPLSDDEFRPVVQRAPLVSIDLLIRDASGALLLGRRNNGPAKGLYFVPGGCIRKDETIAEAFARICFEEMHLEATIYQSRFVGAFEQFYLDNRFGDPTFGTHYVTLAHELSFNDRPAVRIDAQHSDFAWFTNFDDRAHLYNRVYFDRTKGAG